MNGATSTTRPTKRPAVTEAEMTHVVPDWALRLAAEGDGAPFMPAWAFIEKGYSPYSRDKTYAALNRYCDRIEKLTAKRGAAMLSLDELMPRDREIPGRRDGHNRMVSKRLFIRDVLGYLPLVEGFQP